MKPRLFVLPSLLACGTAPVDTASPRCGSVPDPRLLLLPGLLACSDGPVEAELVEDLTVDRVELFAPLLKVSWTQREAGTATLRYRVDGGDWVEAPARDREAGEASHHIIGHTFDQEVELTLSVSTGSEDWESQPLSIETGAPPEGLPFPALLANVEGAWEPTAPYLLNSTPEADRDWGGVWWVFIVDREGHVVWSHRSEDPDDYAGWVSRHLTLNQDRDALLIDRATAWSRFDHGAASTVIELTLDGTIQHTYETPGLHHPFTALPDGKLAWAARDLNGFGAETIQIVDRSGAQEELWSCKDLPETVCGSNTLWWDDANERMLYSFWSSETIAEIDARSGRLIRRFGHADDAWGFSQSQDAFWWQHGPTFTEEGTLLVSTKLNNAAEETVVREYALDEESEQLVEVWSAGEGRGNYGEFGGDAWRLPNGNTLHGNGSGGLLTEFTPDGEVVWEARWPDERRIGQTSWIEDLYDFIP